MHVVRQCPGNLFLICYVDDLKSDEVAAFEIKVVHSFEKLILTPRFRSAWYAGLSAELNGGGKRQ